MIFQQYPNGYLLFDDDQPQAAAVAPSSTGRVYGAGRKPNRALVELLRSRSFQESILAKERQRLQEEKSLLEYRQRRKILELQRQRTVWAVLLAEL